MKILVHKFYLKEIILYIGILLIIFQGWMRKSISPVFSYSDECFAMFVLLCGIVSIISHKKKLPIVHKTYIILFCLLLFIGLNGNIKSKYQSELIAIMYDAFEWGKFFLVFLFGLLFFETVGVEHTYARMEVLSKGIILYSGILAIGNNRYKWGLAEGYERFGIKAYSYPGAHVSFTVAALVFAITFLLLNYQKNILWIVFGCIFAALTLRFKGFGYCIMIGLATLFLKRKIKLIYLVMVGLTVLVVARSAIEYYFLRQTTARATALRTGFQIARKFFPLGSGLGTFGTTVSARYYSAAYGMFGLAERYGFMRVHSSYIADGGELSIVAGQFGWIGLGLVGVLVFLAYFMSYRSVRSERTALPFVSIFGYMVIAASSEDALTSEYAPLLAIALSLVTIYLRKMKGCDNE